MQKAGPQQSPSDVGKFDVAKSAVRVQQAIAIGWSKKRRKKRLLPEGS
jgi:hypothetical protein